MFVPLTLAVSGLARSQAETGSSIETRFFAGRSARQEKLDYILTSGVIEQFFEGQVNVFYVKFPLTLAVSGLVRLVHSLVEIGSSYEMQFFCVT